MADPHLLPCPFCGGPNPVLCDGMTDESGRAMAPYTVECMVVHLDAAGPWACGTMRHADSRAEAIRRWNMRAPIMEGSHG